MSTAFNYATEAQHLAEVRAQQDAAQGITQVARHVSGVGTPFQWNAAGVCTNPDYIYQGGDGKYNMMRVTAAKTVDGDWVGAVGVQSDFGGGTSHLPILQSPRYATSDLAVHAAITRLLATPAAAALCAGSLLNESRRQTLYLLLAQFAPVTQPHREGWASTDPGRTKYHYYGADGLSKCSYFKQHGPLHFPADCCTACDLHLLKAKHAAAVDHTPYQDCPCGCGAPHRAAPVAPPRQSAWQKKQYPTTPKPTQLTLF